MEAWQGWSPVGPDELAASLLLTAPDEPDRPPVVNVFGAMLGTRSNTEELLDDLVVRAGTDPASVSLEHASYRETKRYLAEHGPGDDRPQGHPYSRSEYFRRPLPAEAIESLVETFSKERVAGQSRELDFTPWGGAYNRVPAEATAFAHRGELFLLKHAVTVEPDAEAVEKEAALSWLGRSWATVRPWGPDVRTRTSRTRISKTGRARTMRPTWSDWRASRRDTTRTTSSASTSRSRVTVHRLHEES
jgi:hypothetical protein